MHSVTPILLIEDDPVVVRATTRWLRKVFVDALVAHALDAREAISLVTANPGAWRLIVSDYDLGRGKETGADVLAFLRASAPDLVPHFFFFTGSPEAGELGVPVIDKPSTYEEFEAACRAKVRADDPAEARP